MDTKNWNIVLTNIIRRTNLYAWGNWSLNPGVQPGAVGTIDPDTGIFSQVTTLSDLKITDLPASENWAVNDSSVRRQQTDVDFAGGYQDPTTSMKVNTGLKVSWEFAKEGSISSNATLVSRRSVDDFGIVLRDRFAKLLDIAKSINYATPDGKGIQQGFGVVTHTHEAIGGANIASLNQSSTFSLTGSVDGIRAMTGGGTVQGNLKGSYKEFQETKAFESHLWPAQDNTAAKTLIPLSFQFASFDGRTIMPTWIKPIHSFSVNFDNQHGGTYIGRCKVKYNSASEGPGEKSTTVPGGQQHTISGIPLDATNLEIKVDFAAGSDFVFKVPSPILEWKTGTCTVDMSGVWPWGSHARIRRIETVSIAQYMDRLTAESSPA
ncbi:hypothetical protein [Gluconacetobacter diazotrophicus]|nr:hypothetical protein [Gluconacetobacter diazotrophicus]MBB2156844.1 hypothetical protein [Gluconacetobacter diazotrophicus]